MPFEITNSPADVSPPAIEPRSAMFNTARSTVAGTSSSTTPSATPRNTQQNRWLMLGLKLLWLLSRLLTVRNGIILSVVAVFALVMIFFSNYYAHLVFTKPKQVTQGSFAYHYFVNKFVKELPAFKPLENSAQYYVNVISSELIPVNIMRYESHAPPDEIISYYRLYFEILNYTYVNHPFDSEAMAMFRNMHEGFIVFVSEGENYNTVSIENYQSE
jgi:hypothetical protein